MNIEDYIKEQMDSGMELDDILDSVESAYEKLNKKEIIENQKLLDARDIAKLELNFIEKYYPDLYKKYYKNETIDTFADTYIDSFELMSVDVNSIFDSFFKC